MAGDDAWSDKDCGKTLEGWHIGVVSSMQSLLNYGRKFKHYEL